MQLSLSLLLSAVSSIEKQTKTRAKWPLIEPNGSTNTSNSTANNSTSSTPLAAVVMSSLDKDDTTTTSSTHNSNTTSSLASKYSSLLGDNESNGIGLLGVSGLESPVIGGSTNLSNRYRAEKKITAKVSDPARTEVHVPPLALLIHTLPSVCVVSVRSVYGCT